MDCNNKEAILNALPAICMGVAGSFSVVNAIVSGKKTYYLIGGLQLFLAGLFFEEYIEEERWRFE